jgi:O-antigen/teichoic acid export membrane protein
MAGRAWALLSNFLFVPIYLNLLGIEKFGIIALFIAVGGILAFLDMGLSPTIARELNDARRPIERRASLLFTFETVYLTVVGALVLLALTVPESWFGLLLSPEDLRKPEVSRSIRLLFIVAVVQLLFNFYVAGLIGVEDQLRGNLMIIATGVVRSALVILPLLLIPEPVVYLAWQAATLILFSVWVRRLLYGSVYNGEPAARHAFELRTLLENVPFTGSMFLVSVTAAVNTHVDKLFLGRVAGLEALASYSLVTTFCQLLVFVVSPITLTVLPRMVRTASSGDDVALSQFFLVTHRLVSAITCSMLGLMWFFGPYLIEVWTAGKIGRETVASFAPALVVGYGLLALGTVPHCVAIAKKNMSGSLAISGSVLVTIPAYWLLVRQYGAPGAAATWLVLQAIVVPAYFLWVDRRLLKMHRPGVLMLSTVALPTLICMMIYWAASSFLLGGSHTVLDAAVILLSFIVATAVCLFVNLSRPDLAFLRAGTSTRTI